MTIARWGQEPASGVYEVRSGLVASGCFFVDLRVSPRFDIYSARKASIGLTSTARLAGM